MKKLFAFILLLCHMNSSMFLPQVQEDDVYDKKGSQLDDINSVVEYFQVALGYDHHADDEDSDDGQNFHLIKAFDYSFNQLSVALTREDFEERQERNFSEYRIPTLTSPSYDIPTPPPNRS